MINNSDVREYEFVLQININRQKFLYYTIL